MLTGISVTVAAVYYAMTVWNTIRIRKTQQLISLLSVTIQDKFQEDWMDFIFNQEFSSFEEWARKYSAPVNPKTAGAMMTVTTFFNILGGLIKERLIDPELVHNTMHSAIALSWEKYKPIAEGMRERYNSPEYAILFEHLYNEYIKFNPGYAFPEDLQYEQYRTNE
jgi:hypothetical protein